jgi:hypothetical protein
MSRQRALDNIWLRPTARWGHTEYSLDYHTDYLTRRTGLPADDPAFGRAVHDLFGFDFLWSTDDGLVQWEKTGRTCDMGHGVYAADASDQRPPSECPFCSAEEVWEFDAVGEYGLPDFEEQVADYESKIQRAREEWPNQLTTGGYYRTIVSGAIAAFGWEMFLLAAADRARMERVFDGFFRRALFHMRAWAETSVEAVILHDDIVWTSGGFLHPDVYRKVIIPRYAELSKPLHEAGKKVLFCSDGNFMEYAGDVAEAGADGFVFEPCNDFGFMVDNFGRTKCLVGSFVDCRDLTLGKWEKVRADLDRTFERLADCRGAILAVGNHLPPNIPEFMLDRYFEHLLPGLERKPGAADRPRQSRQNSPPFTSPLRHPGS